MDMDAGAIWDGDEDDVFYEELRRQVLQLTAEDDDDEECRENKHPNAAKSLQKGFKTNPFSVLQPGCYFYHWSGIEGLDSVPRWPSNLWNSGNGTGVFIPQIAKSKRRYKSRKRSNESKPVAQVA